MSLTDRVTSARGVIARSLLRNPALVAGSVGTIAIAVGVNLAVLGLTYRALVSPPRHVVDPDSVFSLSFAAPGERAADPEMTTAPYPMFTSLRGEVAGVAGVAAFQSMSTNVVLDRDQVQVRAQLVSASYLGVLGATPLLGRGFGSDDDRQGSPPIIVLSHAFWRTAFPDDTSPVGRRLVVGGLDYTIAGVMPEGFSGHSTARIDLWIPFAAALRDTPGWEQDEFRNIAGIVIRLARGRAASAVAAQLETRLGRRVGLRAVGGSEAAATDRRVAGWLCGVSILVLLVGLANAATLLMVRGVQGRSDLAIKVALGASRARLAEQAMLEAVAFAGLAILISMLLARWIDEAVRATLFPGVLPSGGIL